MSEKRVKIDPIILFLLRKRKECGLRQEDIADLCETISLRTLQRIEQGQAQIDLAQLREYCGVLNVSAIALAALMTNQREINSNDVAAAAQFLPAKARKSLVDLLLAIAREREKSQSAR